MNTKIVCTRKLMILQYLIKIDIILCVFCMFECRIDLLPAYLTHPHHYFITLD